MQLSAIGLEGDVNTVNHHALCCQQYENSKESVFAYCLTQLTRKSQFKLNDESGVSLFMSKQQQSPVDLAATTSELQLHEAW